MRIATFNLQSLRLRLREGRPVLDGADDGDAPRPTALARADPEQTARVVRAAEADVLALQEVFDRDALDFFHDAFLLPAGVPPYPHRVCLPGNDGRGLNVALLSRPEPRTVTSHAAMTGADFGLTDLPPDLRDRPLFRRDCLAVEFDAVTLFICHFKAPWPDAARAEAVRDAEARAVRRIVETRFPDPAGARWIVLGDLNDPARAGGPSTGLAPLAGDFAADLTERLPPGAGWTYEVPETGLHSSPDRILVSPRLAADYPDVVPGIIRSGMAIHDGHGQADGPAPPHASDHALLFADFPGL